MVCLNNSIGNSSSSSSSSSSGSGDRNSQMRRLDRNFIPGEFDIICARGGEAKNHIGNINFRQKVSEQATAYTQAPSKIFKTLIVSGIIEWVRTNSPNGGFIKKLNDGEWYDVGDDFAREKVGQALREMNHSKYKSSMKSKRQRWKKEKKQKQYNKLRDDTHVVLKTLLQQHYEEVSKKYKEFNFEYSEPEVSTSSSSSSVSSSESSVSSSESSSVSTDDELLENLFTQQNSNLLQNIKSDGRLQEHINWLV